MKNWNEWKNRYRPFKYISLFYGKPSRKWIISAFLEDFLQVANSAYSIHTFCSQILSFCIHPDRSYVISFPCHEIFSILKSHHTKQPIISMIRKTTPMVALFRLIRHHSCICASVPLWNHCSGNTGDHCIMYAYGNGSDHPRAYRTGAVYTFNVYRLCGNADFSYSHMPGSLLGRLQNLTGKHDT